MNPDDEVFLQSLSDAVEMSEEQEYHGVLISLTDSVTGSRIERLAPMVFPSFDLAARFCGKLVTNSQAALPTFHRAGWLPLPQGGPWFPTGFRIVRVAPIPF